MSIKTPTQHVALTGFVPFPRFGSKRERANAKKYPKNKVDRTALERVKDIIEELEMRLIDLEQETIQRHAVALHEIRKLNRNVKQSAERLCIRENRESPELADVDLVNIWKSAEIMSTQFEVIELVANEGLAVLPLKSEIEVYRIFDKCTRIYRPRENPGRISIYAPYGFDKRIKACDKTFPMIPTVLIENALKYSPDDSDVRVRFDSLNGKCRVSISNVADSNAKLGPGIFLKGYRGSHDVEGSGNGLYVAQLVAKQHGSEITVSTFERGGKSICVFAVEFRESLPLG
jgi:light-regulated signal transduction histidine kinase (bacteriophytochrome)